MLCSQSGEGKTNFNGGLCSLSEKLQVQCTVAKFYPVRRTLTRTVLTQSAIAILTSEYLQTVEETPCELGNTDMSLRRGSL